MNAIDSYTALNGASSSSTVSAANQAGSADRFLKLLVAQMQNQDPLNPLDNAQVTSQMAQINTVNGIENLNVTMQGLNGQMMQMQALQGASLVGRAITLEGNKLAMVEGVGVGGYELVGAADSVQVEVLNPAGQVVDTLQLGAQSYGRHGFEWRPEGEVPDVAYSFRITAKAGAAETQHTPLMLDQVFSVRTEGGQLMLETALSGTVPYRDVKAVN